MACFYAFVAHTPYHKASTSMMPSGEAQRDFVQGVWPFSPGGQYKITFSCAIRRGGRLWLSGPRIQRTVSLKEQDAVLLKASCYRDANNDLLPQDIEVDVNTK